MRVLIILVASLTMLVAAAMAQDPVEVDAGHYKVVFENDQVRVLRIHYGPHEKSVMHHHPGAVAVFLADANVRFTSPDGKSQDRQATAGDAQWTPPQDHLPENLSDKPIEVILVEVKAQAPSPSGTRR